MSTPIDIDQTLDASGGANDTYSETYRLRNGTGILQLEVATSTDVDIHFEARLADDLSWVNWITPRTALGDGDSELVGMDLDDLNQVRIRIVNNDGGNQADVRAVLETEGY